MTVPDRFYKIHDAVIDLNMVSKCSITSKKENYTMIHVSNHEDKIITHAQYGENGHLKAAHAELVSIEYALNRWSDFKEQGKAGRE